MDASPIRRLGRDFIARHGETVFNAARRLQGDALHTPLTRAGFAQAEEMGRALRERLGPAPALTLWASSTGRALQTLAIVAEHLDLDWHDARIDPRLTEIGMGSWGGRYYADVIGEVGPVIDAEGLLRPAPDGEDYPAIARRVSGWLADTAGDAGDRLVIMHGISSRVMRGVMTGAPDGRYGAPVLPGHPQGTVTLIEGGRESLVHLGAGYAPA
ncbi:MULTISPECIES: histidine phosphatase family protein [unclassified Sphingomonas]|uniref:histidine phosphatase family protein n=1 Tax=unclassified Sphingomonas TaxID=196159 RepID=UPI00092A24D3|nr:MULTISPECIES: histidine phosphatase family protein [unclassified Sphingomonas]MBN8849303.1 histidine phosphatase family protein [Sphingomonas sp.]OJV34436.1 MAG: histidine phosphatase family protein [Sphingomonas sp. 67-36]